MQNEEAPRGFRTLQFAFCFLHSTSDSACHGRPIWLRLIALGDWEAIDMKRGKIGAMAFLRDTNGVEIPLKDPVISVGRSEQNTVILRHGSVSRVHAEIRIIDGAVVLKDLSSRLGTYVNGQRISEVRLGRGDEIRFGQAIYRYYDSSIGSSRADTASTSIAAVLESVRTVRTGLREKSATMETPVLTDLETTLQKAISSAEMLDREHRRLTTLYEVSGILNAVHEPTLLLEKVIDLAIEVLRAENGFLMLKNQAGELEIQVARGMDRRDLDDVALSRSIAREVTESGRAVLTSNAYEDERFRDQRSVVGLNLRAILCVPMKSRDQRVIGVIYLGSRFSRFLRDDIDLLEAFANQAAMAIESMRLIEESKRSEKLSAIGRMASAIIHDLKNPITSVSGWAEMIAMNSSDTEIAGWANRILREIDRLVGMTGEILAYASGEERLELRAENIRKLLLEAIEMIEESMARSKVEVTTDLRFDGKVLIDRDKFTRVIFNIANNAREAMPDGGKFRMEAYEDDSGWLALRFTDTGVGMPEEIRQKVFEPFVTYGKRRGIGLGMSIVKKLVEVHSGEVAVESVLGKGTTITIRLPTKPQAAVTGTPAREPGAEAETGPLPPIA